MNRQDFVNIKEQDAEEIEILEEVNEIAISE
jgi:hypothetical protein